jgi:hypothetical protein
VLSFAIFKFKLYVKAKSKKKENAFTALLKEVNKNKLCESMDMSQVTFKPYSVDPHPVVVASLLYFSP